MVLEPLITQIELGPMANFVYFLGSNQSQDIFIVDPGWEPDVVAKEVERLGRRVQGILCTHSHYDHVTGIENLLNVWDVPVLMLDREVEFTDWRCENLKTVSANDVVSVGGLDIKILSTPGHTPGSACFLFGNHLVSGDTLFVNGCGRCDLLGGDPEVMFHTLNQLVDRLPDSTCILPGHNYDTLPSASLGHLKMNNPYLRFDSLSSFVSHRMKPRK